jgi:DtxR family transcriptional regulator, Mn-dependent transcriptional regulator
VYEIQEKHGRVATSALAAKLGFAPASITGMVKKLADMNLVTYEKYQGVKLTEAGSKLALEVIRHHRLVELYLHEALGVPWDQVHAEAEKWEHVLSEDLEDRIDAALGFPTTDPHGSPIPRRDGTIARPERIPLIEMEAGQTALVAEVSDEDPAMLRYIGTLGLYPEVGIRVTEVGPFEGPITVETEHKSHIVGRKVAKQIMVKEVTDEIIGT